MSQILVVDDEVGIRELLSEILSDEGYQVRLAQNADEARQQRSRSRPDLVLLDIWMPDMDGITLLKEWAAKGQLTMPVVMMSGHGTIDTAVEATRIGAYAFLEKPIALQKLLSTVGKALTQPAQGQTAFSPLSLSVLGGAPIIVDLKARLERARELRCPVLLLSEPGSGEELCARFLHRANTPWIALEDGAFGASLEGPGALSGEGTLFIRQLDEMPREHQRQLLGRIALLTSGGTRVVSTARHTLPQRVADGLFDPRLYAALSGLTVRIPPLRDHADDIPVIATQLLGQMVEAKETPVRSLTTAALNALRLYPWPGNLSQLEAVVKSAALGATSAEIRPQDVGAVLGALDTLPSSSLGGISLDAGLREARDAFEKAYFEYHIAREGGNMSRVADKVGLERTHLYRKLKQLGISLPRRAE
ncbi:MAG: sigma-54-dependent Fis family transcriptional regulator [Betaproteobacteria bacterium]|nr:sigma-54-dependent Fis family transcriptional regulator [Betaproteobacteria bacterium]MBL8532913.1 sigma-54-dependent Fis family transcriptional regulator [Betaproteobacteria bacterium]